MRTAFLCLLGAGLLSLACTRKGPEANQTYFWRVDPKSSAVEWGQCSDDADFRSSATPIEIGPNSYLIYKVSADGRSAQSMGCTRLNDPTSCTPLEGGLVFDVAGSELTHTDTFKEDAGSGCNLEQTVTWTLRDNIQTCAVEIANTLSLIDNTAVCDQLEMDLANRSPNRLGVRGCVVTFKFNGD